MQEFEFLGSLACASERASDFKLFFKLENFNS